MDLYLNVSLTPLERSKFVVWSDPVGDKYQKIWRVIQDSGMASSMREGVERVRKSTPDDGIAFFSDGVDCRYLELTSCDLKTVGTDFGQKPSALALQEHSPLKESLDNA